MKTCTDCGSTSEEKEFARARRQCLDCHRKRQREWKRKRRRLDPSVREMEATQAGRCAICRTETTLVADHCHESGELRALLCQACNTALGLFREDPRILHAAGIYLIDYRSLRVTKKGDP